MKWEYVNLYNRVPGFVRVPSPGNRAEFDQCMRVYMIKTPYIRRYLKIRRNPAAVKAWADSQLSTSRY